MITTVRPYNTAGGGEYALVLESCLRARQPAAIPWCAWKAMYAPAIDAALAEGHCLVLEMDGVIVGFAVAVTGKLFMVYVKLDFRGNGYGLRLLRELLPDQARKMDFVTTADMLTPSWKAWCRGRGIKFTIAKETDHGQDKAA